MEKMCVWISATLFFVLLLIFSSYSFYLHGAAPRDFRKVHFSWWVLLLLITICVFVFVQIIMELDLWWPFFGVWSIILIFVDLSLCFYFFGQILGFQLHVLSIYNALISVACSLNFWRHRKTRKSFLKKYLGTSYYNLVFQVNYICCINLNGKKQKIDAWLNLSLVHFMKETWRDTFIHGC
jgi:hypothetical protein